MTEEGDRAVAFMRDAQRRWHEKHSRDPTLTDDDIREMLTAIGEDAPFPEFRALTDGEKHSLFRSLLRFHRVLEQFDLLDEELAEDPAPPMSALKRIVAVIPKSPALLTAMAIERSETRGTSFEEEFVEMIELADKAELMRETAQKVLGKPGRFDRRRMQALRRQFEAGFIYLALVSHGIPVPLRDASPGLALAARLVDYMCRKDSSEESGKKSSRKTRKNVSPVAFRRHLSLYLRSRRGKGRFKKKVS